MVAKPGYERSFFQFQPSTNTPNSAAALECVCVCARVEPARCFPSGMFDMTHKHTCNVQYVPCVLLTGEALTHSSLLEADGSPGDTMVTMTTGVDPINVHHAMLRAQGKHTHTPCHTIRHKCKTLILFNS